jgi:hypothetical protein
VEADGIGECVRQTFAYLGVRTQCFLYRKLGVPRHKSFKNSGLFSFGTEVLVEMCGRYRRTSDKQRIAEVFHVAAGLDELPDEPGDDMCPQSLQPVIFTNDRGERQIELMRWAFKLPDKLLFNARSEGIEHAKFWKDAFLTGRCIVPGDALYEWVRPASRPDDCPARSRDRTCRPIGSTLGGQAGW